MGKGVASLDGHDSTSIYIDHTPPSIVGLKVELILLHLLFAVDSFDPRLLNFAPDGNHKSSGGVHVDRNDNN